MAFTFDQGGQGGRQSMMSEITVTPMVDVMLVLLIIFMVAAPMMTQGLEVELPKVDAAVMRTDQDMVVLTITDAGKVLLDETELADIANLDAQIRAVMRTKNTESVFLKADRNVPYGRVAGVMGALRTAGITNIGLVTEPGADSGQYGTPADGEPRPGAPAAPRPGAQAPASPAPPSGQRPTAGGTGTSR
ncbi:MAG: ExbD/TolR family protein [Deltaproteobacteria bacterium]|jgi:biopolymer transport protein TolR|nr:ExbD/TolR family protein [Deltaproteobacteria bacterium]